MSDDDLLAKIECRMSNGHSFTFSELHLPHDDKRAYRIADRAIQRWRKRGWIEFRRDGRKSVWSLTKTAPYGPPITEGEK